MNIETDHNLGSTSVPIVISARMESNQVLLEPDDQDRYVMEVAKVLEACRLYTRKHTTEAQFDFLLKRLFRWLDAHPDVKNAYLTYRDGVLRFVVIKDNAHLDEPLLDSLADLDVLIANDEDLKMLSFDSVALPPLVQEDLQTFINPASTLKLNIR